MALGEKHPVQPGGRQPLLPAGPLDRLREQCLPTFAQTGRGRGWLSAFRTGAAWSTYLLTVIRDRPSSRATARCDRPSTSTLCRTTCT